MKLSIIIVNYNVKYFLEECLHSVFRAVAQLPAEVIVVDNNSVDGSVEWIKEKFPTVKIIANKENVGFSKANNQGIKESRGEYVLLLNPDTVVQEDTFIKSVQFMDGHADAGALGVKMVDGKGNFLPESKRGFPSPWAAFCKMTSLNALLPHSKIFNQYYMGHLPENEVNQVAVLAGAFMLLRKSAIDKTGWLDEDFFMYGEDIDLSWRIVQGGFKNYYFPDTKIIHYKGESTKRGSLNYVRMFYQAMILFAQKHFKGNKADTFIFFLKISIYVKAFFAFLTKLFGKLLLPIIDASVIYAGIYFLKTFWENNIKTADNFRYPPEFHLLVIPLYIITWLVCVFFAGGYDKPYRSRRLIRGVLIGTLIIAAVYAFLPDVVRFSRAIILLGSVYTLIMLLSLRFILRLVNKRSIRLSTDSRRLIIVGQWDEAVRVQSLLQQYQINHELIGIVSTRPDYNTGYIGQHHQLAEIVQVFRAEEIIFCARDIATAQIIESMTAIGNQIDYKIVGEDGLSIIGSNSKNTAGDLYAMDFSFSIGSAFGRRNKVIGDFFICTLAILILPVLIFSKGAGILYTNWLAVLLRKKTWVGYSANSSKNLPKLLPGVFNLASPYKLDLDQPALERMNMLYAKNFTVLEDLRIWWGSLWR